MTTKEQKLIEQKKYLAKVSGVLEPLRKSVNELESEIAMEKMSKYIGKYYLYRNNGGSPNHDWNLYVKPISVKNGWQLTVLTAQKADYMAEIKIEDTSGDHLFQKEISKEVFDKGFNEIMMEINNAKK